MPAIGTDSTKHASCNALWLGGLTLSFFVPPLYSCSNVRARLIQRLRGRLSKRPSDMVLASKSSSGCSERQVPSKSKAAGQHQYMAADIAAMQQHSQQSNKLKPLWASVMFERPNSTQQQLLLLQQHFAMCWKAIQLGHEKGNKHQMVNLPLATYRVLQMQSLLCHCQLDQHPFPHLQTGHADLPDRPHLAG